MDLALSNLQRLIFHKTQKTNRPTNQSCLVLYSFCAILLNSLMWFIVSSHYVLSNFTLIWLVVWHYNYHFTPWEFCTLALADGFPLEFDWQVSSNLSDFSQCSGCILDSLHASRYFQVLPSLYQSFAKCTKNNNYKWYNRHFHVPQFFSLFIIYSLEFCSSVLADGLALEFEWQQAFSSLQDSSHYSGRYQ